MRPLPRKEDVIRIKVILLPQYYAKGEGLYEWRYMDTKFYVDVIDAEQEINQVMPGRGEAILDRLQNFKTVFINLANGEVTT